MPVIIDGSSGITFPNSTVQASAGNVLQVVQATSSTQKSSSSSTFSDTGLTATITPKFATSKILILVVAAGVGKETTNTWVGLKVQKNSSDLFVMNPFAAYTSTTTPNFIGNVASNYIDSPATTSATTYKVQINSGTSSAAVYMNGSSELSSITLMEIAA